MIVQRAINSVRRSKGLPLPASKHSPDLASAQVAGGLRAWLIALGVGAAVFLLAYVCIDLPRRFGHMAPVWLANAVVLSALLSKNVRYWPVIVACSAAGTLLASLVLGVSPPLAVGFMAANVSEYVVCAWAVRRVVGRELAIDQPRHLVFLALFGVLGAVISAAVATLVFALVGAADLPLKAVSWMLANALGLMLLAPCLLALNQARTLLAGRPLTRRSWIAMVALVGVAFLVFGQTRYPLLFLIPPVLAFVAFELEVLGAAVGMVLLGVIAVVLTAMNRGPVALVDGDLTERALFLQLFLVVCVFAALPLASSSAQRRRLKAQAEEAAKVKAEFMANMSHELRTPLTAMLGFAQLVEGQPELSSETRGYVQRVANAGKALRATVNDILDFSKLEAGQVEIKPGSIAPADLVREVVELFSAQAREKGLTLETAGLEGLPLQVLADGDRLRQILLNLIGNAVKFTDEGGVTVTARYEPDERLTLTVADTGVGVAPDQAGQLFQRFAQVDGGASRRHGGTGLGLAICKGLVEAMGGRIGLDSPSGGGARFWFSVPAPISGLVPVEADESPEIEIGLPDPCRVLVVDDNSANRHLVRAVLTPLGVTLREASDGDEGVIEAQASAYDVILMDLRMPRVDGRAAAQRIRAEAGPNRDTPILAFTADMAAMPAEALFAGHVPKPMSAMGLIVAMSEAIAARRAA